MKDLSNKSFGKLTVIKLDHVKKYPKQTKAYWLCKCSCGENKVIRGEHLTSKRTISCGCAYKELNIKHGNARKGQKTKEYQAWLNMNARVNSKEPHKIKSYKDVSICSRWKDFDKFLEDMGNKPSPKHELDRINPYGNYEPSNCRWANRSEQMMNQRRNTDKYLEYLHLNPIVPWNVYYRRIKVSGWDKIKAAKTEIMKNQYV